MKRSFNKIGLSLLLAALVGISITANAEIFPNSTTTVQAEKPYGVIIAVTKSGEIASQTALLLSSQIKQNTNFAPILLVVNTPEKAAMMKTLKLDIKSLPALVYFNHAGVEMNRVVNALPSNESVITMRAVDSIVN